MSKTEKLLIALVAVVIIIIIIISAIIYLNRGKVVYGIDEKGDDRVYEINQNIKRVTSRNDFYIVKTCVNKYYLYYMQMYTSDSDDYLLEENVNLNEIQNEGSKIVYDMLDEEYINSKQITKDNLKSKSKEIPESVINITNMYISERTDRISSYIVYGTLREKRSGKISNIKLIVNLDASNKTFTILPPDYVEEKYKNLKEGEKLEIEKKEEIEKNNNNKYDYRIIDDVQYVEDLMSNFKDEILYNLENVYKKLDETYKSKRFESLDEFKQYVKRNIKTYVMTKVDKYQKTKNEDYTQYVLLATDGNYYIFKETAPMQYTLILDTYTIDIPEFTDKYTLATDQEKVILNLNKFMLAINENDYRYAYGVLSDDFKKSKFPTYDSFVNYMKTGFFDRSKFDYVEFGNQAGTYYTYKVRITDAEGKDKKTIEKTFIILLGDNTDFEISFNLE